MYKAYFNLIDDTLTYLQALYPQVKVSPLPKTPRLEAPSSKKAKSSIPPLKREKTVSSNSSPKKEKEFLFPLESPQIPSSEPQDKWRKLLKATNPELYLHEIIPSDEKAKRIKAAWREKYATPDIPILYQGERYNSFLNHLAKAIETQFYPSRTIEIDHLEKEGKWDLFLDSPQLKLIIAPDHVVFGSKELLSFYKENPQQGTRFLGRVPLLLLPDLSLYFKDPYLKRSLWNVICQTLTSINSPPLS